jgi:hypothetical protein
MVEGMLGDAPRFHVYRDSIQDALTEWHKVHPTIYVMADRSPVMLEAEPLARNLSEMSAAGLEALEYLSKGVAPPGEWRDEKLAMIEKIGKSKSEVEFAILPTMRHLIIAASEVSQLKTMSPAEWRTHVTTLANNKK